MLKVCWIVINMMEFSVEMFVFDIVCGIFDVFFFVDIFEFCKVFDKFVFQNQGGNGVIVGGYDCISNNIQVNEDIDGSIFGNDGSGGNDDKDNGVVGMVFNIGFFVIIVFVGFVVVF